MDGFHNIFVKICSLVLFCFLTFLWSTTLFADSYVTCTETLLRGDVEALTDSFQKGFKEKDSVSSHQKQVNTMVASGERVVFWVVEDVKESKDSKYNIHGDYSLRFGKKAILPEEDGAISPLPDCF